VIGDGQVLQPKRLGRQCHVAQAVVAVAGLGVRMQVAIEVGQFHELGQSSGVRRLDLAAVFAQLRRYVRQADSAIYRFLAVTGDALRAAEHAVLVDLQTELLRDAADRDVVRLGAGEVVQCRTITFLRHHAQVDLHSALEQDAGARLARGKHLGDFVIGGEALHHRAVHNSTIWGGGDQNIQIADGLAHAPEAAGHNHLLHAGYRLQKGAQRFGILRRGGKLETAALAGMCLHCLQDVLLGLFAEAVQSADAAVLCGAPQLFDGLHIEIMVQRLDPFRSEAWNLQQFGYRRGELLTQALQQAAMSGGDDLADLAGEVGADAGQAGQVVAALHQYARLLRQVAQDARSIAIGADAERIRRLDLQQVGDLFENNGDVCVMHGHIRIVFL